MFNIILYPVVFTVFYNNGSWLVRFKFFFIIQLKLYNTYLVIHKSTIFKQCQCYNCRNNFKVKFFYLEHYNSCNISVNLCNLCIKVCSGKKKKKNLWGLNSDHNKLVSSVPPCSHFHPCLPVYIIIKGLLSSSTLAAEYTGAVGCEKPPGRIVASSVSLAPYTPPLQMPLPSAC